MNNNYNNKTKETDSSFAITDENGKNPYWLPSSGFYADYTGTGTRDINCITVHIADGNLSAKQLYNVFMGRGLVSSHYGIDSDGNVAQLVPERFTAFTNGSQSANKNAVTIEVSNLVPGKDEIPTYLQGYDYPISNKALDSLIKQIGDIAIRNNIPEIYRDGKKGTLTFHRDYKYTDCPGDYIPTLTDYITKKANEYIKNGYYIPENQYTVDLGYNPNYVYKSDDGKIVVDYPFVKNSMDELASKTKESFLNNDSTIELDLSGSKTFSAIADTFNSYAKNTTEFNNQIDNFSKMVLDIASSYYSLDASMAQSLDFDKIAAIDLTKLTNFYSNPEVIDLSGGIKDIKMSVDALVNMKNDSNPVISSLLNDVNCTIGIQETLNNFVADSSTKLVGSEFNIIRDKATEFSNLATLKINYANEFVHSIKDACTQLINYFDECGVESLDASLLLELEEEQMRLQKQIEELEATYAAMPNEITICNFDDNNNIIGTESVPNEAKERLKVFIDNCRETLNEITTLINMIYKLVDKDELLALKLSKLNQTHGNDYYANLTNYKNNYSGFSLTAGNNKYELDDEQFLACACVLAAEMGTYMGGNWNYDEGLAIMGVTLKRCEDPDWIANCEQNSYILNGGVIEPRTGVDGTNPYYQMTMISKKTTEQGDQYVYEYERYQDDFQQYYDGYMNGTLTNEQKEKLEAAMSIVNDSCNGLRNHDTYRHYNIDLHEGWGYDPHGNYEGVIKPSEKYFGDPCPNECIVKNNGFAIDNKGTSVMLTGKDAVTAATAGIPNQNGTSPNNSNQANPYYAGGGGEYYGGSNGEYYGSSEGNNAQQIQDSTIVESETVKPEVTPLDNSNTNTYNTYNNYGTNNYSDSNSDNYNKDSSSSSLNDITDFDSNMENEPNNGLDLDYLTNNNMPAVVEETKTSEVSRKSSGSIVGKILGGLGLAGAATAGVVIKKKADKNNDLDEEDV